MTEAADFHAEYAAALRAYLAARGENTLAVGHELGRRALADQISMLEIIENHSRLVYGQDSGSENAVALQFLLQTLAALDVATRGFIDGTRRYEQQRARADDLADRDQFRTALVNSLQEGFFVADRTGAVVEINDAFADITGFGADRVPYTWPHPWMADDTGSGERLSRLLSQGTLEAEAPDPAPRRPHRRVAWRQRRHLAERRPGHLRRHHSRHHRHAGHGRPGTRRHHLATAVSVAKNVAEVLSATLDECRTALGVGRVAAVMWRRAT
jgi:PAS domain-containing protein